MDGGVLFSLAGRTALITGSSSGLGARFAQVAAGNGANVVLVARRRALLEEIRAGIEAAGGRALAVAADVTDLEQMQSAFDLAERTFGTVDLFVANAALSIPQRLLKTTSDTWRRTFATDLDAVVFGAQEASKRMIAAGKSGSIISVASIAGLLAGNEVAAYSIAKAAVIHATKVLAKELGPHGIRVNTIAPGWVLTDMSRGTLTGPDGKSIAETTPLRRYGEVADFDGAFLLLASEAGRYITGVTLVVDGGRMLSPG